MLLYFVRKRRGRRQCPVLFRLFKQDVDALPMFTKRNSQRTLHVALVLHKYIDALHWKTCTRMSRQSFLRYCRSCKVSIWANVLNPYPLRLRRVVGR